MTRRLRVVEYKPGHLDCMVQRDRIGPPEGMEARLAKLQAAMPEAVVLTLMIGVQPVGVVGLIPMVPGVAEVWSVLSDEIKRVPVLFHRTTLALLDIYQNQMDLRRIQTTVKADFDAGIRWAASLGFVQEGRMEKYDVDGSDHILFARCA